jgi:hypothetical protein
MKFLVTVSPVPLTATATGAHVEVATAYSKAVLRAVAGQVSDQAQNVDYFPSYEIITSPNNRGVYFEANKRSVSNLGVETAMSLFLKAHCAGASAPTPTAGKDTSKRRDVAQDDNEASADLICEDELLDAFRK